MTLSPFAAMQAAVDIVNTSAHPTNKIAAACFGTFGDGQEFCVTAINHWPILIAEKIGADARIGGSSGTVHAETSCILQAPVTGGASLCVTDPFCPNCAKNLAEAGIKHVYIDHKGFDKDFAVRRADDFSEMSLRIAERAGIAVYSINRKQQTITPIITPSTSYQPPEDRPLHIIHTGAFDRENLINIAKTFHPDPARLPFAAAYAAGPDHRPRIILAEAHVAVGYSEGSSADKMEMNDMHTGKYTFVMEPVSRLMMGAARLGYKIDPRLVISSRVPTSRELVNMVAAGLTHLHILDPHNARDLMALNALHQLTRAGVMVVG